jgi:hypothetical protein
MQIEWNREALGELEWLDPQVARGMLKRLISLLKISAGSSLSPGWEIEGTV